MFDVVPRDETNIINTITRKPFTGRFKATNVIPGKEIIVRDDVRLRIPEYKRIEVPFCPHYDMLVQAARAMGITADQVDSTNFCGCFYPDSGHQFSADREIPVTFCYDIYICLSQWIERFDRVAEMFGGIDVLDGAGIGADNEWFLGKIQHPENLEDIGEAIRVTGNIFRFIRNIITKPGEDDFSALYGKLRSKKALIWRTIFENRKEPIHISPDESLEELIRHKIEILTGTYGNRALMIGCDQAPEYVDARPRT